MTIGHTKLLECPVVARIPRLEPTHKVLTESAHVHKYTRNNLRIARRLTSVAILSCYDDRAGGREVSPGCSVVEGSDIIAFGHSNAVRALFLLLPHGRHRRPLTRHEVHDGHLRK